MLLNLQPFLVLGAILLRQHPDKNHYLIRSSCSQIFLKIGVLKILAIFTEKHLCWSLFIENRFQHRRFSVNIAKFLRTAFLQNTSSCCFYDAVISRAVFTKVLRKISTYMRDISAREIWMSF